MATALNNDNAYPNLTSDVESPLTTPTPKENNVQDNKEATNATLLLNTLTQKVHNTQQKYHRRHRLSILSILLFFTFWLLCIPLALSTTENWTYQSSWYYSIQAGFGVGYGAIRVETRGMEYLLACHLFLGSLYVVYLVSTFVGWSIQRTVEKTKQEARNNKEEEEVSDGCNIGKQSLGQQDLGLQRFFIAAGLYILVLIMGILYGTLREEWYFSKSLLFAVSTCQTSGLVPPDINPYKEDAYFNPLFVMFLVMVGVPIWAYKISALCLILLRYEGNKRAIVTVMERRREALGAILRMQDRWKGKIEMKKKKRSDASCGNSSIDSDNGSDYIHCQVDRLGFLTFWLLEQNLLSEETILNLMKEFDFLKGETKYKRHCIDTVSAPSTATTVTDANENSKKHRRISLMQNTNSNSSNDDDDDDDVVPLWKINAHLQFLQLVELKLVEKHAWPSFLESMEKVMEQSSKEEKLMLLQLEK